jgi:hypothetical protein
MSPQMTLDEIATSAKGRTDPVLGAKAFVARYPEAYGLILKWARRDVEAGNKPSMHGYLWLLRRMPWISPGKRAYKVDNRWSAPLVDIVCTDDPELGEHFERRGSHTSLGGDAA